MKALSIETLGGPDKEFINDHQGVAIYVSQKFLFRRMLLFLDNLDIRLLFLDNLDFYGNLNA